MCSSPLARAPKPQLAVAQPLTESAGKNQIPYPSGGRPTNWGTVSPKKLSHCCGGFEPHVRLPSLGIQKWTGNPRESGLEGQWGLITGLPQDLTKQSLRGYKGNFVLINTQRQGAVTPWKTEPELPASAGGSPTEACVGRGSSQGQRHWQQHSWKIPLGVKPLGGPH